jgi:hypothetical protein
MQLPSTFSCHPTVSERWIYQDGKTENAFQQPECHTRSPPTLACFSIRSRRKYSPGAVEALHLRCATPSFARALITCRSCNYLPAPRSKHLMQNTMLLDRARQPRRRMTVQQAAWLVVRTKDRLEETATMSACASLHAPRTPPGAADVEITAWLSRDAGGTVVLRMRARLRCEMTGRSITFAGQGHGFVRLQRSRGNAHHTLWRPRKR